MNGSPGGWARETASVLRAILGSPSLRRVLLAYFLYVSLLWGTWVAMLLWAVDTLGTAQVGIAAAVQLLPAAVFAAVAATLADRYPRRRMLPLGYLAQAVAFGSAGTGILIGWPPAAILAALTAAACTTTLTRPVQGALLPELARTPSEATAANALVGMAEGVGVLAGPLAAAAILLVRPVGDVLLAGAAAALLACALVVRLAPGRAGPTTQGPSRAADTPSAVAPLATDTQPVANARPRLRRFGPVARMLGGLRALSGNAEVAVVVGILGLRMLLSGMLDILVVLLALDVLGLGGSGAGALQASFGLGTVLGGAASVVLVGRRRLSLALAFSALLMGAPLVVLGGGRITLVAPLLLAAGGIGFAMVDVTGRTILQRVADPSRLATVLGSLEGLGLGALSLGSLLAPALVGVIGVGPTVMVAGLLLPVAVAVAWVGLRRIDGRATIPVREIALLRTNPIFAPLSAPQLEALAGSVRWVAEHRGSVIIREGDPGDRYLVLVEGSLEVTQRGAFVRTIDRPGDGVGEIALVRGVPRTATVTVAAPAVLLALGRDEFLGVITGSDRAREAGHRIADARTLA